MGTHRLPALLLASGLLSAIAFACLVAGLATRVGAETGLLFRVHDGLAVCAAIAIAFAAVSWRRAPTRRGGEIGAPLATLGAVSGAMTALALILVFLTRASDMLYMLPQAGIGLWLMATCVKQPSGLSRSLCGFGLVVGMGLLLVGGGFIAIAAAQGPELWALHDQKLGEPDPAVWASPLNVRGHQLLALGTLLGVATFPVWTLLAARALSTAPQVRGVQTSV
jgi:hypothetical protein